MNLQELSQIWKFLEMLTILIKLQEWSGNAGKTNSILGKKV